MEGQASACERHYHDHGRLTVYSSSSWSLPGHDGQRRLVTLAQARKARREYMVSRNPPRKSVQHPEKTDSEKNDTEAVVRSSGAELGGDVTQVFQNATAEYTADLAQVSSRLQDRLRAALEELVKAASPMASSRAADELNSAYRDILTAFHNQDWEKTKSAQTAYLSRVQAQYGDAESAV